MRSYFIFSLVIACVLGFCLLYLIHIRLQINRNKQNRHGSTYLFPIALTILFVFVVATQIQPRVLDAIQFITGVYPTEEVILNASDIYDNRFVFEGTTYYFRPDLIALKQNVPYRIYYTQRTHYVVSFTQIGCS